MREQPRCRPPDALCSQLHAESMAERKRLWDWELRKALHILDANYPSDSTVLLWTPWCQHCRMQTSRFVLLPCELATAPQIHRQWHRPTWQEKLHRVALNTPAPLVQYLVKKDAKAEHNPDITRETSQSHSCDTPSACVKQGGKTSCPAQIHKYTLSCCPLWVCCSQPVQTNVWYDNDTFSFWSLGI